MAKEYEVAGTVYEFPDNYTDQQVRDILKKKGVIKTVDASRPSFAEEATNALGAAWKEINPWEQLKGMYQMSEGLMADPAAMGKGILDAQGQLATRAKAAFETGDYLTGLRHSIEYLIPVLGPKMSAMGDELARGENIGENIGEAIGTGLSFKIPGALDVPGMWANKNAVTKGAVDYLQRKGVTVPAGPASGSKFLNVVQKGSAYTPIGSIIADRAEYASQKRLGEVADELAQTTHPAPQTPLSAGTDVRGALNTRITDFGKQADTGYAIQRQAEPQHKQMVQQGVDVDGNPVMEEVAMPVDISQLKAELLPIYKRLLRKWEPARRNTSAGFTAIQSILDEQDWVPASVAEDGLGGLKQLSRDDPEGASGGLGRFIIPKLEKQIDDTVGSFDPAALQGLQEGRKFTAQKHATMEARDSLGRLENEGVRDFGGLTLPKDQRIGRLRTIAAEVPAQIPKVARAYIEDLFNLARKQGGFIRNDLLWREWEKLGDETKQILFPNPKHREDVNHFFLGIKKLGENPNPSGTALMHWINRAFSGELFGGTPTAAILGGPVAAGVTAAVGLAGMAIPGAVAKMMYSPRGVKLLTEGMTIPISDKLRAAHWTARAMRIVDEDVETERRRQDEYLRKQGKAMIPYTYANPALDPRTSP